MELDSYSTLVRVLNGVVLESTDRCEEAFDFYRSTARGGAKQSRGVGRTGQDQLLPGKVRRDLRSSSSELGRAEDDQRPSQRCKAGYAEGGFKGAMSALAEWRVEQRWAQPDGYRLQLRGGRQDPEKPSTCLERAVEEHHSTMPYINVRQQFRSLRNEPRFQELLRRMNSLPKQAIKSGCLAPFLPSRRCVGDSHRNLWPLAHGRRRNRTVRATSRAHCQGSGRPRTTGRHQPARFRVTFSCFLL